MHMYLLWASQGEYSDRHEWPIAVYTRKEDAEADTTLAGQLWREVTRGETCIYDWDERAEAMASDNGRLLAAILGLTEGQPPSFYDEMKFYCCPIEVRVEQLGRELLERTGNKS